MTPADARRRIRAAYHGLSHRCVLAFPCLSDPARRSSLCLKFALVLLQVVVVGVLFLFNRALVKKTRVEHWYTVIYLGLFTATLIQYFITCGSSPWYVVDVMREYNETTISSLMPWIKHSALKENESLLPTTDHNQLGKNNSRMNSASWLKLVMDLYPTGSSSSFLVQSIVMIARNASSNLITIAFG